jgi:translation initiation factor IF-3
MSVKININNEIKAKEIRLISEDNQMIGILPTSEAQKLANEAKMDLIEISPNATPPVCKISDYGKFKYEKEKKDRQNKKTAKGSLLKEVIFSPKIDKGDFETKVNHIHDFLNKGYKVKISSKIRGRDWGMESKVFEMFGRIKELISENATIQEEPKKVMNGIFMIALGKKIP